MGWMRYFRRRFWDDERTREIESYIDIETDENIARGMSPEDARFAARRKFGNGTFVREEIYRMNTILFVDSLWQDLRYTFRSLRRDRGFAAIAIITLALGIGANTALFSVLNALVLRQLPVKDPGNLAVITFTDKNGQPERPIPLPFWRELSLRQSALQSLIAYSGGGIFTVEANGNLAAAVCEAVSADYFSTLGIHPHLGRLISPVDTPTGGEPANVVVLNYGFWLRQFGGNPNVVGQSLRVDGFPLRIIGVTPPGFSGLQVAASADFTFPITLIDRIRGRPPDPKRSTLIHMIVGRLRPGVTLERARAEIGTLFAGMQAGAGLPGLSAVEYRDLKAQIITVESASKGFTWLRTKYERMLYVSVILTGILLLMACVNLTGMALARSSARQQQFATSIALGASPARVAQQLVIESLLLACTGALIAIPIAWWLSRILGDTFGGLGNNVRLTMSMTPDAKVLSVTAAVTILTGLAVSVLPALTARRLSGRLCIQRSIGPARATSRWNRALLATQVALSFVLLFGAGQLVLNLTRFSSVDPGFRPHGILWTRVEAQPGGYRNLDVAAYYPELVRRISTIAGVQAVSLSRLFPELINDVGPLLHPVEDAEATNGLIPSGAIVDVVSPRFFETTGIPFLRGRDFTWGDRSGTAQITIVNEVLARRLFGSDDVIGRQVVVDKKTNPRGFQIVGVVHDASMGDLHATHVPVLFRPCLQEPALLRIPVVVVRTAGNPSLIDAELRRTVPTLGHEYVRTTRLMEDWLQQSLLQEHLLARLSIMFGIVAAILAMVGVYGLLAYAVSRRTPEIGVRMALGASRPSVMRMVVLEGLAVTVTGVIMGVPAAYGAWRIAGRYISGLAPDAPLIYALTALFLTLVAMLAGLFPGRRAAEIDPIQALRRE